MLDLSRRRLLKSLAGASALGPTPQLIQSAYAATPLTAIEWGGDVVDAMKQVEAKQSAVQVNWALHQGGSGAILPKIKAGWPKVDFDYVAGWEGSFHSMVARL